MQFLSSIKQTVLAITLALLTGSGLMAQEASTPSMNRYLNAGIGASIWGIPFYGNLEFPISAIDNASISVGGSYQTKKEVFAGILGDSGFRHTVIGFQIAGNYYVDEMGDLPPEIDLIGGIQLDYYLWKTKYTGSDDGILDTDYSGAGSGGLGATFIVAGRYHFSDMAAVQLTVGGGSVFSSVRLGMSIKFK